MRSPFFPKIPIFDLEGLGDVESKKYIFLTKVEETIKIWNFLKAKFFHLIILRKDNIFLIQNSGNFKQDFFLKLYYCAKNKLSMKNVLIVSEWWHFPIQLIEERDPWNLFNGLDSLFMAIYYWVSKNCVINSIKLFLLFKGIHILIGKRYP